MNYVASANFAFKAASDGIPLSVNLLENLQARLVRGTQAENPHGGKIRDIQVMIGKHAGARVEEAQFIPPPPGLDLPIQIRTLLDWIQNDARKNIDPVVAAAMAHYQFETRRADYYDSLLEVSTNGNWDKWINFFARGLETLFLGRKKLKRTCC